MKSFFYIHFLLLLLVPITGFGFGFTVTYSNESCQGNGSVSFMISNPDPNGSIVYVVYRLPDITTPYASGPSTTVNGLSAGDYRIIARETVGSTTITQQQDITITSSFVPLTYTIQSVNQACSNSSTISITADTGTAAIYEIISGPAVFPPQASNTFSGLAVGLYRIKVTDNCGNSLVQAFTVTLNPSGLTIRAPEFTYPAPATCTTVLATNTIVPASGTVIAYPLQIHYILHLTGGDTHIYLVLNSGDPGSQDISQIIPYQSTPYVYDVIITDGCGTTHPTNSFIVSTAITLSSTITTLPCNEYYFTLNADDFVDSYILQFTDSPAGFNPTAFNTSYPGPFTQSTVDFGSTTNPVPFGDYKVTITDICGNTTVAQFSIVDKPPVPIIIGINNGCIANNGRIVLSLADYRMMTAIVTVAPANYPFTLPHNITALISDDGSILTLNPVPLGDYVIVITDDCNDIIPPLPVTVGPYVDLGMTINVLQGCDFGTSSLKITSDDSKPVSARIIAAPSGYPFPLPHDISNHIISSGEIYLTGLTAGNYTFSITDSCGFTSDDSVLIDGYVITTSNFSLIPDCGAFNIALDFVDNVTLTETFWLQKLLDPVTNTWGHPDTATVYTSGTVPNATNSYSLPNNATTFNLTFNGIFRIVHHFQSYHNGTDINSNIVRSATKDCIEILSPNLTFSNALSINDVYLIPCSTTGNFDVFLSTSGASPLHYQIVEKDGFPYVVDNGTSDVFLNLTIGIYKFEVEDSCGNSINITFDVSDLTSLVTIYPVCDMFQCVSTIIGNETFDLTTQSAALLGIQSPSEYTLSYYTSQLDADNNTNAIANITTFNPTSNPQTIYIRLFFNLFPNCYQTASFEVQTRQTPILHLAADYIVCDGQPITLDASVGNLPSTIYLWSNGITIPSITVSDIGITSLSITATNDYGNCNAVAFKCTASQDITVTIADVPEIDHIESMDWTDNENSITVVTTTQGAFEYSIDGNTFQDSPIFQHLLPGLYTVFVRDAGGCNTISQEVWLLNYPKFFTPNGDGYNETWYVKNSDKEPDFKVYIFDRYGKLITNVISNGPGWDGKLNGKTLFADDYWFAAYRQDGRILKGHFTLKR